MSTPAPAVPPVAGAAQGVKAAKSAGTEGADAFAALLDALFAVVGVPQGEAALPSAQGEGTDAAREAEPRAAREHADAAPAPAVAVPPWSLPPAALPPAPGAAQPLAHASNAPAVHADGRPQHREAQADALRDVAPNAAPASAHELAACEPLAAAPAPCRDIDARPVHADVGVPAVAVAPGSAPPAPLAPDAPPIHHAALPSQPHEPSFATDLGAEVRWMVGAGVQEARLELHPADLGPIDVQLTVTAGTADIRFAAAHDATRDGLAQALPALRDMLAAQGLQLGQAAVGAGHSGTSFGAPQRQGAGTGPAARGRVSARGTVEATGAARLAPGRGMLDLYA